MIDTEKDLTSSRYMINHCRYLARDKADVRKREKIARDREDERTDLQETLHFENRENRGGHHVRHFKSSRCDFSLTVSAYAR